MFVVVPQLEHHMGIIQEMHRFQQSIDDKSDMEGSVEHLSERATQEEGDKPWLVTRSVLYKVQFTF